jgi:uncharacterized membrane protein
MTTRLLGSVLVLAASLGGFVASGCSDDTADGTSDCSTVKGYAELSTAFSKCTNCHASTLTGAARNSAPEGQNYDTYDLAKAQASKIATRLRDTANPMPPPGYPPLAETERTDLITWGDCDAPP